MLVHIFSYNIPIYREILLQFLQFAEKYHSAESLFILDAVLKALYVDLSLARRKSSGMPQCSIVSIVSSFPSFIDGENGSRINVCELYSFYTPYGTNNVKNNAVQVFQDYKSAILLRLWKLFIKNSAKQIFSQS